MKFFIGILLVGLAFGKRNVRSICLDKPDEGFCGESRMMWNFNQSTGTCHQFRFGGCGGNGNRYKTEEECLEKCKDDVCGENERYNRCGTYCPLTCENYDNPPTLCPAMCKNGCECENGFVRREDGKCVRPLQCQERQEPTRTIVIKDDRGQQLKSVAGPYDEGDYLLLVCEAGGDPAPVVTWWRNGVLIDDTFSMTSDGHFSRNEFRILELQRSDFMVQLTCQASNRNPALSMNASVKIDMNLKPLYVHITTAQKPVKLGENLTLNCETSGSRPEAKIVWSIDNELIQNENQAFFSQHNGSEGNMTYSTIRLIPGIDDNGKTVICKAENPVLPHIDIRDTWMLNIIYNICGENERYNDCGSPCPVTCEKHNLKDTDCATLCDEGCECESGFVRRADGRCVRPKDCRQLIKKDDILVNCTECPDPGFCDASLIHFFYDSEEKRCKEFVFGGCGGNTNNFESEEECKSSCFGRP